MNDRKEAQNIPYVVGHLSFTPHVIGTIIANLFDASKVSHQEEVNALHKLFDRHRKTIEEQERRIEKLKAEIA